VLLICARRRECVGDEEKAPGLRAAALRGHYRYGAGPRTLMSHCRRCTRTLPSLPHPAIPNPPRVVPAVAPAARRCTRVCTVASSFLLVICACVLACDVVVCCPESFGTATQRTQLREFLDDHCALMVFDEAHTVLDWCVCLCLRVWSCWPMLPFVVQGFVLSRRVHGHGVGRAQFRESAISAPGVLSCPSFGSRVRGMQLLSATVDEDLLRELRGALRLRDPSVDRGEMCAPNVKYTIVPRSNFDADVATPLHAFFSDKARSDGRVAIVFERTRDDTTATYLALAADPRLAGKTIARVTATSEGDHIASVTQQLTAVTASVEHAARIADVVVCTSLLAMVSARL
jgi:superfamily II DNA helicase RecQ